MMHPAWQRIFLPVEIGQTARKTVKKVKRIFIVFFGFTVYSRRGLWTIIAQKLWRILAMSFAVKWDNEDRTIIRSEVYPPTRGMVCFVDSLEAVRRLLQDRVAAY